MTFHSALLLSAVGVSPVVSMGVPVVASPLYKQHFRLEDGQCLEDDSVTLRIWSVSDEAWIEA